MAEDEEDEENVCRMSVEIHTRNSTQLDRSGRKKTKNKALRMSLASLPLAAFNRAATSLRDVKLNKDQAALFMLKAGALELVRRGVQHRFPPLWWLLQAIPLFRAPPFVWLQRWAPFRYLIQGSQELTKPVLFLSIATAFTNVMDHRTQRGETRASPAARAPSSPPRTPRTSRSPTPVQEETREDSQMRMLKRELDERGIFLPDRITDDELQRFFHASNRNTGRFVDMVRKNVRWRQHFRFLTPVELEEWSELVYWHHHDSQRRPLLIVRLGIASATLVASRRPRFVQAIVSQIEYGVLNLLTEQDARMTVVLDCAGAPSVGFPLHMTKSCCVLVQENYPTRLAALFIVNLPPFVRVLSNAIVKILKPATREKIIIESENSTKVLADHLGGMDWVPIYLGGTCKCSLCNEARTALEQQLTSHRVAGPNQTDTQLLYDSSGGEEEFRTMTVDRSFSDVLRMTILGLLMLWIILALIAGLTNPIEEQLPT